MKNLNKNKKGQGTLETTLAFIAIFLLVGGIIKIWMWANRQIVERQLRYNITRVVAGTGSDIYEQPVWPLPESEDLKEEEVLLLKKD